MSGIELVLFDVDGVLTDGSLFIDGEGELVKAFNARDGIAVALLRHHGVRTGFVSGKSSASLDFRTKQLDVDVALTGRTDKLRACDELAQRLGIRLSSMAFVGDDVIDLPLAGRVGQFFAPRDAHPLVLAGADVVVDVDGGHGVARAVSEHVLIQQGHSLHSMYAPLLRNLGVDKLDQ